MFSLINFNETLNRSGLSMAALERYLVDQRTAIKKVITYYRSATIKPKSNDIFVKLLYRLTMGKDKTAVDYFNVASKETTEIAMAFNLTTSDVKGTIHKGEIFGEVPLIMMVSNNTSFGDIYGLGNWKDLAPVKVLKIPTISNSIVRPDIAEHMEGFGIITIDLPLLGFMYGNWVVANNKKPIEDRLNIESFVAMYLYPNMIWSQYDAVILESLNFDIPDFSAADDNKTPIIVPDRTNILLGQLHEQLARLDGDVSLEQVMQNIPSIKGSNLFVNYPKLKTLFNNNNILAELVAGYSLIKPLANIAIANPEQRTVANAFRREMRKIKSQNVVRKISDQDLKMIVENDLSTLEMLLLDF